MGTARALISQAHAWARSQRVMQLLAGTEPDNLASVALLTRTGFILDDASPDHQGFLNFRLDIES
jgi:L-amino acid N-acyltransferase YncA